MLKLLVALLAAQATGGPPPSDAQVLRALRPGMPNMPFFHEAHREDVKVVKTRVGADRVALLLPGAVEIALEVTHWGCDVYYTEVTRSVYPFPVKLRAHRIHSVYLDTVRLVW